jgi:hypothetical protein
MKCTYTTPFGIIIPLAQRVHSANEVTNLALSQIDSCTCTKLGFLVIPGVRDILQKKSLVKRVKARHGRFRFCQGMRRTQRLTRLF